MRDGNFDTLFMAHLALLAIAHYVLMKTTWWIKILRFMAFIAVWLGGPLSYLQLKNQFSTATAFLIIVVSQYAYLITGAILKHLQEAKDMSLNTAARVEEQSQHDSTKSEPKRATSEFDFFTSD